MQKVLWRALEARGSCNCAICTPVRPGLARQVTTVPTRRGIKFGDVVTVFYGTVLGTAAFYDGSSKKRRRENIDNALVGLLLENEAAIKDQEARLQALGYSGSESVSVLCEELNRRTSKWQWSSWNAIFKRPSLRNFSSSQAQRHYSTQYLNDGAKSDNDKHGGWQAEMLARQEKRVTERLRISSRLKDCMANEGVDTKDERVQWNPLIPLEARSTAKTIEKAWEEATHTPNSRCWQIRETAVARLILKLVKTYLTSIDTKKDGKPTIELTDVNGERFQFGLKDVTYIKQEYMRLSQRMEALVQGLEVPETEEMIKPFQFPHYLVYGGTDNEQLWYNSDINDQNDAIVSIFLKAKDPAKLISDLCTFLMSRQCGPNIHTMNLILLFFLDMQWYQACKVVISTVISMAANQNEVTDAAKLQYYHLTQEGRNLDIQRAMMFCLNNKTTRVTRAPEKDMTETFKANQVVAQTRLREGEEVVQYALKAEWTAEAFTIVVIDLLDREELTEALAEIATMRISGLQETTEILEGLIQYGVFAQDWDIVVEAWLRYEELDYPIPVLTWYWMLQACATCDQVDIFHKLVAVGRQQGVLSKDIEYLIGSFYLSATTKEALKRKVHALQRLQHRIPIPQLSQRDLQVQNDDIIQMPNLEQTMLTVYLQYAKLRMSTSGWLKDHLSYLQHAETEYQGYEESLSASPEALQNLRERWAVYNAKLEAFVSKCHGSYASESSELGKAIKRMATEHNLAIESTIDTVSDIAHTKELSEVCGPETRPSSMAKEEKAFSNLAIADSESRAVLLEQSNLSQSAVNNKYDLSHSQNLTEYNVQNTYDRNCGSLWAWHRRSESSGTQVLLRIRCIMYTTPPPAQRRVLLAPLPLRKILSCRSPPRPQANHEPVTEVKTNPGQPQEEMPNLQPDQKLTQRVYQDDDNVDIDDAYGQDYRLIAGA